MKKLLLGTAVVLLARSLGLFSPGVAAQDRGPGASTAPPPPRPAFAEPGISPDGANIAFVSGGDIWEVPSRGGEARLLVSHPATESRPIYSGDGKRLAFTSTRTGNGDVYVLTLATGDLTRLTYDDANELVTGWSRDGKYVYFSRFRSRRDGCGRSATTAIPQSRAP
jgi:Tol biopolymer transport system component